MERILEIIDTLTEAINQSSEERKTMMDKFSQAIQDSRKENLAFLAKLHEEHSAFWTQMGEENELRKNRLKSLGEDMANSIPSLATGEEEELNVVLMQLDRIERTCIFVLESDFEHLNAGDDEYPEPVYYHAKISDPEFRTWPNIYSHSFASSETLRIVAKKSSSDNGEDPLYLIVDHK